MKNEHRGFIALISVIVVSVVLLLTATILSFSGFYARYNILDSEMKKRSAALADACVDEARIRLAADPAYLGNATTTVGDGQCYVGVIDAISSPSEALFKTRSMYKKYYTVYTVRVRLSDAAILSFEEVPAW